MNGGSMNGGSTSGGGAGGAGGAGAGLGVLVFTKTTGYRHESIPDGIAALSSLANERDWRLTATEDAATFSDAGLAPFDVVVFLSTTGDVLGEPEEAALERFVRAGRGFAGIHSASDTEYEWAWYGALVGAYFRTHPEIQSATLRVEQASHPAVSALPALWTRTDEWYAFQTNPRANVNVLLTVDESSYTPGAGSMGADHPMAWYHEYDGGRSFYTALGHTSESYTDPLFIAHLVGGIEWAAGR
jgi:cytochrome c